MFNIEGVHVSDSNAESGKQFNNESKELLENSGRNLRLDFNRRGLLGLVNFRDFATLTPYDLAKLKLALDRVSLDESGVYGDKSLGKVFWNENNAILRGLDPKFRVERPDAKARYANLTNLDFDGFLRLLGIISCVRDGSLLGYEVEVTGDKIPSFDSQLTYPVGSTSSTLGKTQNPYKSVVKITPVVKDYKFITDFSVSSMHKGETKFLTRDVLALEVGADCQAVLERALDEGAFFNALAVDVMNDIYREEACYSWASKVGKGQLIGKDRARLFNYIDAAYNTHATGVLVSCLQSKTFPDPIKVGNAKASSTGIPGLGTVAGLIKDDKLARGVPRYGWDVDPEPEMVWNTFHTQASPYYCGTVVDLATSSNTRLAFTNEHNDEEIVKLGHFFVSANDVFRSHVKGQVDFGLSMVNLAIMESYSDSTGYTSDLRPDASNSVSDISQIENVAQGQAK